MSFESLGLAPEVLRAVQDSGYTTPTPIQEKAIPEVLKGRDLIGIAQTGTGKTASFTLPMIHLLGQGRAKARMPRTLILEPTRELAAQVAESFEKYGKYHKLSMALLIGGVSFGDQDAKITRGVDVLIATPGRLLDHFERGKLLLTGVQVLVVDEADRMLDMGFIPDVERICKLTPFTRQTLFFSATMPPEIRRLTESFLQNPVTVEVARPATTASTITQTLVPVPSAPHRKRDALRTLLRSQEIQNAIIFCNRKTGVAELHRSLVRHGFSAGCIHGDLEQPVRMKTLDAFKRNEIQLLVASDVAARGLDIPAVSHVFNFDVPIHADDYVHRIGRTGRAGRAGAAFTLCTQGEQKYLDAIEALTGKPLDRLALEGVDTAPEADDAEAAPAQDRRRGRARGRGTRPEKAAQKAEPATIADAPAPKPRAEPRGERRREATADPRPVREEPIIAPARTVARERDERRGRGRDRDDLGPRVTGFGDATPAFMLRAVRLPRRDAAAAAAAACEAEPAAEAAAEAA